MKLKEHKQRLEEKADMFLDERNDSISGWISLLCLHSVTGISKSPFPAKMHEAIRQDIITLERQLQRLNGVLNETGD